MVNGYNAHIRDHKPENGIGLKLNLISSVEVEYVANPPFSR